MWTISVRKKGERYYEPGEEITKIKRVLIPKMIGNFNPFFCRYNNKLYLVNSLEGDLSDPFRRTIEYSKSFYIEV